MKNFLKYIYKWFAKSKDYPVEKYPEFQADISEEKHNEYWLIKMNGEKILNPQIDGLAIEFNGKNSIVEIYEPYNFKNCKLRIGTNNRVIIKYSCDCIENLQIPSTMRENAQLIIGKNFSCASCEIMLHDEAGLKVVIGDNCMFSYGITIWPSDGHAIVTNKGKLINRGKDIIIGNHVWCGMNVHIFKGSIIPDNSIVGAGTIFLKGSTRGLEKNDKVSGDTGYIFAGNPARLIKKGKFTWKRENCYDYLLIHH